RFGWESGNEDEAIRSIWTRLLRFEINLITTQSRHFQVANDRVIIVRFDLEEGLFPIKSDIDQKIFVGQNPLQSRSKLLVVIDHKNGFELEAVDVRLDFLWFRLKVHQRFRSALVVPHHGS